MADVSVVHLVWAPLGRKPVERFVDAYRRHPAGRGHRLVVAFNGFGSDAERGPVLDVLSAVDHAVLVLPEPVQDIPAYLAAARHATSEYVCFLNSYSTPLVDDWLATLAAHAARPGVGIVGATGSWESHYTGAVPPAEPWPRTLRPRPWAGWLRRSANRARLALPIRREYSPFPNPHLRSNAFMLRRTLFLDLHTTALATKNDAYRFESGRRSMTRQVLARGLRTLVVGRDGAGYRPEEWSASRTYRSGEQENLLVADNRTREYAESDAATRRSLTSAAWGGA